MYCVDRDWYPCIVRGKTAALWHYIHQDTPRHLPHSLTLTMLMALSIGICGARCGPDLDTSASNFMAYRLPLQRVFLLYFLYFMSDLVILFVCTSWRNMQLGKASMSDKEVGRLSVVGVASRYALNGTAFEPRCGKDFPYRLRGSPSLLCNGHRVFPESTATRTWRRC
jgi:hypothetical protein